MRVKTIVKALSWAVLTAALAPANDDGGISGVVVDDKGARIANASVSYQRVGETITVYAVGGPVVDENRAPSGYPLSQNVPIPSPGHLFFRYQIYNARIASYLAVEQPIGTTYYGQVGGYVGLYQINLGVPPMPTGTYQCSGSEANASVGDTLFLCVKP